MNRRCGIPTGRNGKDAAPSAGRRPAGRIGMTVLALLALHRAASASPEAADQPAAEPPRNLALDAKASASESQDDLLPDKARDGDANSRWSGIPGHNQGVWFELDWDAPQRISEVYLHQYDRYVMELDVQAWDESAGRWRTLRHHGKPGQRLPLVIASRFDTTSTRRLRIGNITNGPSFTEVRVYAEPFNMGLVTAVASDLRGNAIGMVTDSVGAEGIPGAQVTLTGRLAGRAPGQEAWQATARSDEAGRIAVPLPLGLVGTIQIDATLAGKSSHTEVQACSLPYALTPRDASSGVASLDGVWKFAPDPPAGFESPSFDDRSWRDIQVPGHWEMQGFHPAGDVGGYRVKLGPIPEIPGAGGRVKLAFDGVYSGATVWVNGTRVAMHEGGATPFECDITAALAPTENVLAVRVVEHTTASDQLDKMSSYADFPLGGIMRSVRLVRVPELHLGAIQVRTEFDGAYKDATLRGSVVVVNEGEAPGADRWVRASLVGPGGARVAAGDLGRELKIGAWERVELPLALPVTAPLQWDAEHPNLYTLSLELGAGATTLQKIATRVGFRQTQVRGAEILINGSPVKIRGTCHHDSHPLLGRAVTPALERQDLELMRAANFNALRTSHYPPLPELLDIADELGLYVEDEAPFCWVGVSNDLRLAPRITQLTAELLARDRNHPSVALWSLCNESEFGRGFELTREWVKTADPSRPLSAAISAWLDIATAHNPMSLDRLNEYEALDKPMLFDESLAPYQGIWGDAEEMLLDPGLRDSYVEPLIGVYDRMMRSRTTQGSLIWAWSDDLFCVPGRGREYGRGGTRSHFVDDQYRLAGRGIVGDAPWGLVDGWRRPKPEYWIMRKIHSPVRIGLDVVAGPAAGGQIRIPIENRYDFTDLAELTIHWRIDQSEGECSLASADGRTGSIPARGKGELVITGAPAARGDDPLEITFTDRRGVAVDEYRLPRGSPVAPSMPLRGCDPVPLVIREEATLAGHACRIIGGSFELAVDRDTGRLRRCVAFDEPVLLDLPSIHVLKSGRPREATPDLTAWRNDSVEVKQDGEVVRIRISGSYPQLAGAYDLSVTPEGEVTCAAKFTYTGPDMYAREIGLRLGLVPECTHLEWSRRAEWSVYPDDHIGRPRGAAEAVYPHADAVPPTWAWSQDNSPLGSSDFRSTKRHIDWVSLTAPPGIGIAVISDGTQASRACVRADRTELFINDWSGGTGAGLWEWQANYGAGKLVRSGDSIEAKCRFRLVSRP